MVLTLQEQPEAIGFCTLLQSCLAWVELVHSRMWCEDETEPQRLLSLSLESSLLEDHAW